jgi:dipeptidyl aminopeptidase/acylaminoacyl peptidase
MNRGVRFMPTLATLRSVLVALCANTTLIASCIAATTPLIPVSDFIKPDQMASIRFSPSGSLFAAMVEDDHQTKLAVVDFSTNKARRFRSPLGADVRSFRWLTDDLIDVETTKRSTAVTDLLARHFVGFTVDLSERSGVTSAQIQSAVRAVAGSPEELIVAAHPYVGSYRRVPQLDVIDARTGDVKRHLTDTPPSPGIYRWILDSRLQPRAAISQVGIPSVIEIWWRDTAQGAWRKLHSFDPEHQRGYYPVAMDAEDNLLVVSNIETGYFALYRFDFDKNAPGEVLVAQRGGDIGSTQLLYASDRSDPVGVRVDGDRPQDVWFDERRQATQDLVDKSLPTDATNRLQFLPGGKVLVESSSGRDPGTYYFYDPTARSLSEWSRARPWIDPERMASTRVLRYKARDGLEIPAYLTLPQGREPKQLPLVVWVHGGPQSRDSWGYDPEVQFFANRGYAVLRVNFRGSTGFGERFVSAGYRQWGRAMQDDLTDGARQLIANGLVDPKRVCIGGASYGGYAALMGPIREPELFRCAIDLYGPSDLTYMVELPEADYNWGTDHDRDRQLFEQIGNPSDPAQRPAMDANSPRLQASKLKAPVLLVYGTDDQRVPLRQGYGMRDAFDAIGAKNYEWKTFSGEGHGVRTEQNSAALLELMERFLQKHLGASSVDAAAVP